MVPHAEPFAASGHLLCCGLANSTRQMATEGKSTFARAAAAGTFAEPRVEPIPEGWFGMGYDGGRDDEKPAHRVWVDAFAMAACQVTRAEYGLFLAATSRAAPP